MQHIRRARKFCYKRANKPRRVSKRLDKRTTAMWYRDGVWRAKISRGAYMRRFPEVLCFLRNPSETLESFDYTRKELHRNLNQKLWFRSDLDPRKEVTVNGYIGMEQVREMSTSAALVLAAEYERRTLHMEEPPPIFDLENWDVSLLDKLNQIGFFERFGYSFEFDVGHSTQTDVLTVPFYSGSEDQMEKVDQKLLSLVQHIDPEFNISAEMRLALNSAVGEAVANTREHAYQTTHEFKYPHVQRWWATGAASASERKIVVSLFDQGVTIPVSYPKLPVFAKMMSKLSLFDDETSTKFANDAKLIGAAARYGKTGRGLLESGASSGKDEVKGGYGLPQIKDAIELCGGGSLMILSRGGRYLYRVDGTKREEDFETYDHSVGGTLIEWTVTLPEPGNEK